MLESFFDWSDEQGLPFRSWADALQEKGIPPAALLLVPILLIAGLAFLFFAQGPSTGSLVITASTISGEPLPDVSVKLTNAGDFKASATTDSNGRASFEKVPAGKINVNVNSPTVAFAEPNFYVDLKPGATVRKGVSASLQEAQGVSLVVDVQTADAPTLVLLDSQGKEIERVAEQTSFSFSVAKNTEYVVRAEQDGFTPDEQRVQVAESNRYLLLAPLQKGAPDQARLHVRVVNAQVGAGAVANATVRIFRADALVSTVQTSEDGSAPAVDVPLAASLRVVVSAVGFSEGSQDVNVTQADQSVSVSLSPLPPEFSGVRVTVRDAAGNSVYSPLLRLYSGSKLLDESFPEEGIAVFNVTHSSSLAVSVYKSGYLPAFVESIPKDALVVLSRSDNRSSRVRVHVADRRGNDVSRASVWFLDDRSRPLGLPVRLTGEDGTQVFDDVPLAVIQVRASDGVRTALSGPVLLTAESNETVVELAFDPMAVDVPVLVVDHFSRSPLAKAKVSAGNASCTADAKGACTLSVLEGDGVSFHVAADGYSGMDSAPLPVYAAMPALTFELTSSSVAQNVRLRFDGVFDVSGRKSNALAPLSEYEARYSIVSPGVEFAKAEAEIAVDGAVVLGGQGVGARLTKRGAESASSALLDIPPVVLTADGFSQPAFEVTQGVAVWFVNEDNVTHFLAFDDGQSVTIPDGQNRSVIFNKVGGFSFKSLRNPVLSGFVTVSSPAAVDVVEATGLLFEYGPFNGTRQFSLRFKTGSKGPVVLQHRSAFFTPIETLRAPADGLSESARLDVSFSGTCTEKACVQWYFLYNGRKSQKLDLPWGKTASVFVNVYGLESDGVLGVSSGTPAIQLVSGRTNSSTASVSPSSARIRADARFASAEFSFKAVRLAADAPLLINVSDGRTVLFEAEAFVNVFAKDTPALVVSVKPNRVEALSPSRLVFTVKDTLGQAIEGARVSVGEQEATEKQNASGIYVLDEVEPDSLSPIAFEVTKESYRPYQGSIAVDAPENAVVLTPAALALSVDSKEPQVASVQLSNKLADKLRTSISVTLDSGGQITDVTSSTTSITLAAKGSASFDLKAAIKQDVLEIARKAGSLKEKASGTVHVRVSGKGYSESFDIPFSVDAVFQQTAMDETWSMTPDALQYNLEPPKVKDQSVEVTVSNNAPYPMVFNVEQTLGLSVQPASLTLAPGSQDAFKVKAFLPREVDCFSEDLQKKGALTVHGTFQGLTSKKTASISLDVSTANLACQPPNGLRVTLPIDVRMEFLANARVKTNPDGSTSVLLPNRELLWFDSGASVTPIDAQVPQGSAFVLDRRHVQPLADGGWTLSFPVGVTLNLPSDADYQPFGSGQSIVTLENAQIILPPGVQTPQAQANVRLSAAGVRVPPLQSITFRRIPFNYDALQNLLPTDPVEIKLPTDATFDLLPGTVERKNVPPKTPNVLSYQNMMSYLPKPQADANLQNLKAIQLPNGERMAFGSDAAIDVQKGSIIVPSGTSIHLSRSRLNAINGLPIEQAFELRMPMPYALNVLSTSSGTPKAFKSQDGKNVLKVTEDAVVQAAWALSVTKQDSRYVLRVAGENALAYLKGAYAHLPYDPASVAKCSMTYAPPDAVSFTLPAGTAVQKTAKGYEAILPACDDASRLSFSVSGSSGTTEVFRSPAVRKVVFSADSDFVVGDASDAEEKSVSTSGLVELTACLKDDKGKDVADSLKEAKVSFSEDSVIAVPERILGGFKENQADVDLGTLTPISLGSKSGQLTQLGSAKKLTLHPGGGKIQAARQPAFTGSGLLMPKGSGLSFLPVCEKGSGRLDITATAEDVFVALDKDGKTGTLEVTFSNKNPESFNQKKEICLFNNGKQSILLDAIASEPDASVPLDKQPIFLSITGADSADGRIPSERAYFSQPAVYGKHQKIAIEPGVEGQDNCRRFTVELTLPSDVLFKDKCIDPSKVPSSMTGRYAFKFNDANADAVAQSEKHLLPLKMIFDADEKDCQALTEEAQFADLTGISVNYDTAELAGVSGGTGEDKLYFKNAGHERYFAIINNEEKPIRVKSITGAGTSLMTCSRVENQQKSTFQLQVGAEVRPAEVLLLSCTSNPGSQGKQGPYIIEFVGESFKPIKTINVQVWNPGPSAALYPYSPIGKAVPFFDVRTATPKENAQQKFASYETWAFADPAPAIPSGGVVAPPAPEPEKTDVQKEAERKSEVQARQAAYENILGFRTCKKFFCTSSQAERAVYSFASTFRDLINRRIYDNSQAAERTALQAFCTSLDASKTFSKSTIIQLAEGAFTSESTTTQSLQLQQQIRTQYFPEFKEVRVTTSGAGTVEFRGCGIYRLTAVLNPACSVQGASAPEWVSHMEIDLRMEKLQSCPVNLANAALLTADAPASYAGNQLGTGSLTGAVKQVFSWNTLNAVGGLAQGAFASGDKSKVAAVLEGLGRLRQGVLGTYGSDANDKDTLAVKATYASAFGANATSSKVKYCPKAGFEDKPCPAVPYENANFCWRTGGPVLTKLGGTVTAIVFIQAVMAANPATVTASGGSSVLVGVRSVLTNYRLITAVSGCTAGALAEKFQGRSVLSCRALEACTSSVLAGMVEMANPFFGGWKPVQAERVLLRSTTTGTALASATGSVALQSILGASAVAYLENLAGPDSTATPPVVPITLVLRQGLSPNKVYNGYIAAKQYVINVMPGASYRANVANLRNALAAEGLYGREGIRVPTQVATAFYESGGDKLENAFENSAFRAVMSMTAAEKKTVTGLSAGGAQYLSMAEKLVETDAVAARSLFIKGMNLEGDGVDTAKSLRTLYNRLLQDPAWGSQTLNLLTQAAGSPADLDRLCPVIGTVRACSPALFADAGKSQFLKAALTDSESKFLVPTGPRAQGASLLTRGSSPMRSAILADQLSALEEELQKSVALLTTEADVRAALTSSRYYALIQETGLQTDLKSDLDAFVKTKNALSADGVVGQAIVLKMESGGLSLDDLQASLRKVGLSELPPSFAGVSGVVKTDLAKLSGTQFFRAGDTAAQKLEKMAKLQLFNPDGTPLDPKKLTPELLSKLEADVAGKQETARKLLSADRRAGLARGASAFAAFLSAFLFNTDFRPVQIQVLTDTAGSHVIGVHTEKGQPSAESICLRGAAGTCDSFGGTGGNAGSGTLMATSSNVIAVKALCNKPGLCLRLLQWRNGQYDDFGLVVGFNDDAPVDPRLLGSIFLPEEAPLLPSDLQKIKMPPTLSIDYAPLTASGFNDYQPEAENPVITNRQNQIQAAQALVDNLNSAEFKRALSDADRRGVIQLANQAITAYRAGKDAEGAARLAAADAAQTRLLSGITGGTNR